MFCFTLSKSTLKALELYLLTRLSASILETGTKNTRETCMDVVYPVGKRMFKVSNIRNRKTAMNLVLVSLLLTLKKNFLNGFWAVLVGTWVCFSSYRTKTKLPLSSILLIIKIRNVCRAFPNYFDSGKRRPIWQLHVQS